MTFLELRTTRRALDLLPEDDHFWRGAASALLGLAYWAGADLSAADLAFSESVTIMHRSGDVSSQLSTAYLLADLRLTQGRLRAAESTSLQALSLAAGQSGPVLQGTAEHHLVLSEVHLEQNDLVRAMDHLETSQALGKQTALPEAQHRWYLVMARIKEAQGDFEGALNFLDETERIRVGSPVPDVRPIPALKARVLIAQGQLVEALAWANTQGLTSDDNPSYLREFELITLASALLAAYQRNGEDRLVREALTLLAQLLPAAEAGERLGSVIEILVLQALALQAVGDVAAALVPLARAVALAEPEGHVRIFVCEGAPMAQLLTEAVDTVATPDYVSSLLAAFGFYDHKSEAAPASPLAPLSLAEPLSDRELEVLRLVAQGLSNREICDQLFLALSTVKGHNRNIYGKLQVQRRTEAVARARELGLV